MSDTKINNFVAKYSRNFNKPKSYKKRLREQEDKEADKEIMEAKKSNYENYLNEDSSE